MNKFECVVFDLDGTLIDSIPHLFHVYRQFLQKFGFQGSKREFDSLNGPKLDKIVAYLKKKYDLKPTKYELLKNYNNEIEKVYRTKISPMTGVKKLLEFLQENGYGIGLVTSSNKKNTNIVLKKHNLLKYFSFFVYGDDVTKSKPAPDIYKICIRCAGIEKNNILVLEDSKNGYDSAISAGLRCKRTTNFSFIKNWLLKNNIAPSYQFVDDGPFIITSTLSNYKISVANKKKINRIWNILQKKRKHQLINNKVLCLNSIIKKNNKTYIHGNFFDYKIILADKFDSFLKLNLQPIGVSGMIIFYHNKKAYTIFSQRSKNHTDYVNYFELVPSGHINMSTPSQKRINFYSHLTEEFVEETGVNNRFIQQISSLCLIKDRKNCLYDICSLIELSTNKKIIQKFFYTSSEYSKPIFIPISNLSKFIEKNYSKIVPTSLGIIKFFLHEKFVQFN